MPNQRSLVDYFPQEIIDKILDNFRIGPNKTYDRFQDNRDPDSEFQCRVRALLVCALVCRAFTPRCQYHLFSTVELHVLEDDDGERERREGIYQMMLAKPHIADGVRDIAVYFGENYIESVFDEDDLTPGLLLSLRERQITSITLYGGTWRPGENLMAMQVGEDDEGDEDDREEDEEMDDGEDDGDDEMDSGEEGDDDNDDNDEMAYTSPYDAEKYFIRPFIRTAFITSLNIYVTTLRPSVLSCFPNLVKLILFVQELDPSGNNRPMTAHAQLQVLTLSDVSIVIVKDILGLDTTSPVFDLSHLRVLDVLLYPAEPDALMLGLVFDACAQSVEELTLCGEGFLDTEPSWKIYDLSRFEKLTMLHLSVEFKVDHDPWNVPNPFIDHCRFLATVRVPNKMEDIAMEVSVSCLETISPLHCLNNVPGWDDLDYQFARILSGSSGETLELNLHIKWEILRHGEGLDKNPIALITKEARKENTIDILRSTFTQALRKTLRRVGQDSGINLKITYDCIIPH